MFEGKRFVSAVPFIKRMNSSKNFVFTVAIRLYKVIAGKMGVNNSDKQVLNNIINIVFSLVITVRRKFWEPPARTGERRAVAMRVHDLRGARRHHLVISCIGAGAVDFKFLWFSLFFSLNFFLGREFDFLIANIIAGKPRLNRNYFYGGIRYANKLVEYRYV